MANILIIEDDEQLADAMRDWLRLQGHSADVLYSGSQALKWLSSHDCDIVILDLMIPGIDGFELCKRYRAAGGEARIVIVTAKTSIADKELGLGIGADDYLCKPFEMRELSARIGALLRRPAALVQSRLTVGELTLDANLHAAMRAGKPIKLLPQEFVLLEFLMRNPNRIFSAEVLVKRLWRNQSSVDTVRTHIKNLRRKIDQPSCAPMLKTVHGVGYALVVE